MSLISSNPNGGFAKAGDNLTLRFTTSEVVRNPLDYLNIQGVGPIDLSTSDNGTNWIATAQVLDNASGTPSLSLEVLDQAGNRGSPYIDNFSHITLDTSSPVLTGLSFVSSNLPDNSSIYAKAQDNLTLSFQFQEPIQTPIVSIAGDNQSLHLSHNSDNTSWVAVYTVQPGDNGSAIFRIDYQDLAGNYGTPVDPQSHTSIPGSVVSVMMDTQPPTLSSLNISSNNIYDPSLAKLGDNLTLSFVSDEALMTPTGELAGRLGLNAVDNSSATDWYFTTEVLPATPEDNVSFRFDISDLAGNVVTGFNSTLNNSSVRVDKTPPLVSGITLVSTNDNGSWAKAGDNLTLQFSTSETVSTPSILIAANSRLADNRSLDGKQWETLYEVMQGDNGTVNWDFTVRDLAGNVSDNVTQDNASLITIDTQKPVLDNVSFVSSNTFNSSFAKAGDNLTLRFSTVSGERILEPTVLINHQSVTVNLSGGFWEAVYPVTLSDHGTADYLIAFSDFAGNAGDNVTGPSLAGQITLDNSDPYLTLVQMSSDNDNNSYLAKSGDNISLIFESSEILDNQTTSVSISGSAASLISENGTHWEFRRQMNSSDTEGQISFSVNFADQSGNYGIRQDNQTTDNRSVIFDRTRPTAAISYFDNASNSIVNGPFQTGQELTIYADFSAQRPRLRVIMSKGTSYALIMRLVLKKPSI